jgi:uncharacterized protein (DUF342 family)
MDEARENPEKRKEGRDPDAVAGRNQDGRLEIVVSDDKLTAKAVFTPPLGDGRLIDMDYLQKLLDAEGLVFGVDWDAIGEAVFTCNTERKIVSDVVIAKGLDPEKEIPSYLKLEKRFFNQGPLIDPESLKVDFRTISPFIIVRKGERIATVIPPRPGKDGTDVFGKPVAFTRKDVVQFTAGKNTERSGDGILAACEGRFERKDNSFWVSEILQIKGAVDYSTGNIQFPGDVFIEGMVQDGFRIYAGGSIVSKSTLDASEVAARKDLSVEQGIIGKKQSLVRVGGTVKAKFIEGCTVECRGSILVEDSMYACEVYTLDSVQMGEQGKIVGGSVFAVNGVSANQIGNQAHQRTRIQCGVDFVAERKLEQLKQRHAHLSLKLTALNTFLKEKPSERAEAERDRLAVLIQKVVEEMNACLIGLHKNQKAEVVVTDKVFPGVEIDICNIRLAVDKTHAKVKFALDPIRGKISIEKLDKQKEQKR